MSSASKSKGKKKTTAAKNTKGKKDPKASKAASKGKKDPKASKAASKGKGTKPKSAKKDPKASGGKKGSEKKTGKKKSKGGAAEEKKVDDSQLSAPKSKGSSKHVSTPSKMVDPGPDIILPETKEFVTKMPKLTVTQLKDDDNVEELNQQFEELQRLLRQRKKDCLLRARILVAREGEDTPPICIDIKGMKHLLSNVGLKRGEANYDTNCKRQAVLDKGNELLAYEAKQRSVQKTRDKTTPEAIQADIAECKRALGEAEPILQAAKDAVKEITKSSLDEIRALPKPSNLLVRTVKACAIMVGTKESELDSWGNVKKLLKTTFINNLLEFEARNITSEIREKLESSEYLGKDGVPEKEQLTQSNVSKANRVAGCLVQWLEAQLQYNEFLPKVEPELARLEELKIDLQSIDGRIEKLEKALSSLSMSIDNAKGELRDCGRAFDKSKAARDTCQN